MVWELYPKKNPSELRLASGSRNTFYFLTLFSWFFDQEFLTPRGVGAQNGLCSAFQHALANSTFSILF
jgi:hypothetical protein